MDKSDFFVKYNAIIKKKSIDVNCLYQDMVAIVEMDYLQPYIDKDNVEHNHKRLNIDDFALTIQTDEELQKLVNPYNKLNKDVLGKLVEVHKMPDVQIYRLLLDSILIELGLKNGRLYLTPTGYAVSVLRNVANGGLQKEYCDEATCEERINKLYESFGADEEEIINNEYFDFCSKALGLAAYICDKKLLKKDSFDVSKLFLPKKYDSHGFDIREPIELNETEYLYNIKQFIYKLYLRAFENEKKTIQIFKLLRTNFDKKVNISGIIFNDCSLELETYFNKFIDNTGDICTITNFNFNDAKELLKIWYDIKEGGMH